MVRVSILVGSLVAFAVAIPQQAEHISKAQLSRFNQIFARDAAMTDLDSRSLTQDGSCGSASGLSCGAGNCCSSLGWCGATPLHCGTGCQAGFGSCGTDGAPTDAGAAPASVPSPAPSPVTADTPKAPAAPVPAAAPTAEAPPAPSSNGGQQQQQPSSSTTSNGLGNVYKQYSGDGSTSAGWPSEDSWMDFETAFGNNKANMEGSCQKWGVAATSDSEAQEVHDAILAAASSSGVDSRYILAVMMQESGGCVRAPTTNGGIRNPGLMQSFNGKGTCNEGGVQTPCPASEITQMVNDGVSGTGEGSNSLASALARVPGNDASRYYKAARVYNSGSIDPSGSLQAGIATHCYSSDIANRLTGWASSGGSPCTFD